MLAKNWGEPMGAPAIFEKQIEIKQYCFKLLITFQCHHQLALVSF
ncbi:MAG: hypothetical protein P8X89_13820 [Reinekea sp.]